MARNAFVRVNDEAVQRYLRDGEAVGDLVHDTAKLTRYFARGHINSRTGELSRMIQVNRPSRSGTWETSSLVWTRTKYALWVHDGTAGNGAGYIYPKNGQYLTIPRGHETSTVSGGTLRKAWRNGGLVAFPDGKPYYTAERIHGQKANPYLEKGLSEAMAQIR